MKKCIIPGSYDPVTKGHVELFKIASGMFSKVYVVILSNSEKKNGMFSGKERLEIIEAMTSELRSQGYSNIEPILFDGLTTDAARDLGAEYLVKGVRNTADFAYEYDLSQLTRRFDPALKTVFIPSNAELACVSSTYLRELIKYGKWDSEDFADGTTDIIRNILTRNS